MKSPLKRAYHITGIANENAPHNVKDMIVCLPVCPDFSVRDVGNASLLLIIWLYAHAQVYVLRIRYGIYIIGCARAKIFVE